MKVIVVHEDGDRVSRVTQLYEEVRDCVARGSMKHQGVVVERIVEDPVPAVPQNYPADNEVLVQHTLTLDLKKLGIHPGGLFLARKENNGTIVMEPCRIERLT